MIVTARAQFPRLQYAIYPKRPRRECSAGPPDLSVELEHLRESRVQRSGGFEWVQPDDDNQRGPSRPMTAFHSPNHHGQRQHVFELSLVPSPVAVLVFLFEQHRFPSPSA
jgi:hypothetical protein